MRRAILVGLLLLAPSLASAQLGGIVYGGADPTARANASTAATAAAAAQSTADNALNYARTLQVVAVLTAAAEAANTRAVTVAVQDRNGDAVTNSVQLFCELRDAAMLPEVVGAFRLAETGLGSEDSTTAKPAILITTTNAGAATLTVTDVAGASGLTTHLFCRPVSAFGALYHLAVTFDGV